VFRRYFDSVYSLTVIYPKHGVGTSAAMGCNYLWMEIRHMIRHHPLWLPYYALYTVAKTTGTIARSFRGADAGLAAAPAQPARLPLEPDEAALKDESPRKAQFNVHPRPK